MIENFHLLGYNTRLDATTFWSVVAVGVALLFFYCTFRPPKKYNGFWWFVLIEYAAIVLCVTVLLRDRMEFPKDIANTFFSNKSAMGEYTLSETIANILMFFPIGVAAYNITRKRGLLLSLVAGTGFSLFIETLQYFTDRGVSDIFDVLSNGIGALVGDVAAFVITKGKNAWITYHAHS